jgi:hypothetical protein
LLNGPSFEEHVMCEPEGHIEAIANETATLAGCVAGLKFEDIPHEGLARAKLLTQDFLGRTIRARRDAESTPFVGKMAGIAYWSHVEPYLELAHAGIFRDRSRPSRRLDR